MLGPKGGAPLASFRYIFVVFITVTVGGESGRGAGPNGVDAIVQKASAHEHSPRSITVF